MAPPRIHVYTVCWNEEVILPFFLDWYARFASRIFVHDNGSDDRTAAIARAHPKAELVPYDTGGQLDERNLLQVKSQAWKAHRQEADWALVVDADEFVDFGSPGPEGAVRAARARGAAVIRPIGFNVVLDAEDHLVHRPGRLILDEHHLGVHHKQSSKPCFFDLQRIESVEFLPGAHRGTFTPATPVHRDLRIRLYHYKYIGVDAVLARFRRYATRLSERNREKGYGFHYLEPEQKIRAEYAEQLRRRRDVRATLAEAPLLGPLLRGAFAAATRLGMNA